MIKNKEKTEKQELRKKRNNLIKKLNEINKILTSTYKMTVKEALNRIYEVKVQSKGNTYGGRIHVPMCLGFKKVKLKIVKGVK